MVDDRDLEDTRDEESYSSDFYSNKEAEELDRADYEYDKMMDDKYEE